MLPLLMFEPEPVVELVILITGFEFTTSTKSLGVVVPIPTLLLCIIFTRFPNSNLLV